jgi:AraC-like DNA-binding protein
MFGVAIPLPLAAALLAGIVAVRVILVNRSFNWPNCLIALFFALLGIQSILTSIRFGPALKTTLPIQPVLAMLICPIAFVAFRALRGPGGDGLPRTNLLHTIPAVLMAGILGFGLKLPVPIDSLIWASFLIYNILLFLEIGEGPDNFERFGTEAVQALVTARIVTVCLLAVILAYDVIIFINLEYWGGNYTNEIVAAGSLLLIAISFGALLFPNTFPIPIGTKKLHSAGSSDPSTATAEDNKIYEDLERLMRTKQPFLDPNINIVRLARQLKVPARSVSNAVNRVSAQNFSQFVNRHRVSEACSLLSDSSMPITEIMFEAGFQTKSTFNREFLAVVGKSPSNYRKDAAQLKG